ncbi:MAG: hypothetical protein D6714_20400 [Bacteroidetes bacterium]|nr:MAG: hypothetical protein D6714_20400 [Bacteroidota bacterium]
MENFEAGEISLKSLANGKVLRVVFASSFDKIMGGMIYAGSRTTSVQALTSIRCLIATLVQTIR